MTVLITGCYGFVGSNLCSFFSKNNIKVIGIYSTKIEKSRINLVKNTYRIYKINMFNISNLEKIIKIHNITHIIHTSWIGVAGEFRNSNIQNDNLQIVNNLIKIYKKRKIQQVTFFGSQAEYKRTKSIIGEKTKLNPTTTYGVIKKKMFR